MSTTPLVCDTGPSKWAHDDDDDDIVEVVESRTHGKGKTSGRSAVSNKTATDLSQALATVRAEAVAAHAANLQLQVRIEQLAEALAEHGIKIVPRLMCGKTHCSGPFCVVAKQGTAKDFCPLSMELAPNRLQYGRVCGVLPDLSSLCDF
ncbi:hypothetical protein M404DRAFT_33814 [Pisolithus tinctorius Marx 270]|uniref:Uncharacterized protein n=1 Tax=Pisolithus tinctorius Marx 270 TaxID=870435 RepID=A0A0C3N4A3_PISTI|nr:hypothetical protein M404DRAFT_33814 [Pisolithus tinctorius Marx 270]